MRFHYFWITAALAVVPAAPQAQTALNQPGGVAVIATPAQAVAEALARSPALRGADASRQATRGEGLQAGLRPNPEASLVVENFGGIGGRGTYRGTSQTETTLGLSQRLELGGKRGARIGFASQNEGVAGLDYEAARLDLARDVVVALADAVAATRTVNVEQERARLTAESLRTARARVDAGKESLLQARRAEVARTAAELAVERARREAEAATDILAVAIGAARVELGPRQPWFEEIGPEPRPPLPADPFERLKANPDLSRFDAVIAQRRADVKLQRANAVPDVTLQGYVRRFEESRETAFIAGASMPLPITDRNQGGIARAAAELTRAEMDAERGRAKLATSLVTAERRMEIAWRATRALRRDALPAAEQAARFAAGGYAEGKFSFLDVLEAQRGLSDTRAQLNEALREFHARRAEVERLRGQDLGLMTVAGAR